VGDFDWHEAGLTVGQVAERSGVAASAIRFYERKGLLTSDRTSGNQRRYRGDVLCRIAMIRACQRAELSIAEIRGALAQLPEGHIPTPEDWDRLAHHLRSELRDRIEQLTHVLDELSAHDPRVTAPTPGRPSSELEHARLNPSG
jgi:MerR family transcriptional regulator, redox-sensitive transcriptional activator SoxR